MPEANPPRTITWLHLSDLHYCKERTGWDAQRVMRPLIKDLKNMEKAHGLSPDLLFFTGDAAFGEIPGSPLKRQFAGAHKVLEDVRTAFSNAISKENVFIVPGNHDVDSNKALPELTEWLGIQKGIESVQERIDKNNLSWESFMQRLSAYREFLKKHGYSHLLDQPSADPDRLIYGACREVCGIKLGIAGFNTAWSCTKNDEKRKLWCCGSWQAGKIQERIGEVDFAIGLTHHPFGWFTEHEDEQLRGIFERDFAVHLHGHEHAGWVTRANDHLRVAAAAYYEHSEAENGYNFVRLNLDTGEGEVWLRRYDKSGGGWIPRVIANKTNNDGCWHLGKLPFLERFTPPEPVNPK